VAHHQKDWLLAKAMPMVPPVTLLTEKVSCSQVLVFRLNRIDRWHVDQYGRVVQWVAQELEVSRVKVPQFRMAREKPCHHLRLWMLARDTLMDLLARSMDEKTRL